MAIIPHWRVNGRTWTFEQGPKLMGILNVTPDSFSDGGRWSTLDLAVAQGTELAAQGADMIDVGGESTRPGAEPVSVDDELRRVVPVIERLSQVVRVPISIDTMKARVAAEALAAGADVVNDVSAGLFDNAMASVCAASECGVILMHMRGTPQTMQLNPHYDDVVAEVTAFLCQRMAAFESAGVDRERIMLDPGIGFGKTAEHNLELLRSIDQMHATGRPLLIGHSRKGFLKKILGRDVDERLAGTIGVAIGAASRGAAVIRVHDVQAVRDALTAWRAIVE